MNYISILRFTKRHKSLFFYLENYGKLRCSLHIIVKEEVNRMMKYLLSAIVGVTMDTNLKPSDMHILIMSI